MSANPEVQRLGRGPSLSAKEFLFKVLVIGDYGVGKTAIIRRYTQDVFTPNYKLTIGVDFSSKTQVWDNGSRVTMQLWDIAGHERYGQMTRVYYKYAHAAIIVFDQTRNASFDSVIKWLSDVKDKVILSNNVQVPVILLANKCDLKDQHEVDLAYIGDFMHMHGIIGWYQTSAKENTNIDDAMQFLLQHMMTTQSDPEVRPVTPHDPNSNFSFSESIRLPPQPRKTATPPSGGCCGGGGNEVYDGASS